MAENDNAQKEYIELGSQRGHTRIHISTWKVILNNFLGGLAWGLGTVLGATVIVAVLIILVSKLHSIPFIGDFIGNILQSIPSQNVQ
ncbi:MAG: DUF5665 domain-containing protein [bacterium]|nr:DUF5665 domain-containing protein [bacterium]